jgi:protein-S-isoprenylcysteine O-methyltransferase Ste14
VLPGLIVVSPVYIAYVDRRQHDPGDAYAQLGALALGRAPADNVQLWVHARGWAIKAFFLPLMFVYVVGDLGGFWSGPLLPAPVDFEHIFPRLIDLLYLVDVFLAAITYALTLRPLDSHIRSADPTVAGWLVCLALYPPFNTVTGKILPYDQDGLFWGKVFAPYPALYVVWGTAILVLVAIYAWSTAAFGLRFSNLTHRGIITNGPYRWSKHPAYLSKNLSWWMISVPFIAGAGWLQAVQSCLLLGGINLLYFLRARTEERHLSRDPVYRDYAAFIAEHGLFAVAGRTARRLALSWAAKLRSPA